MLLNGDWGFNSSRNPLSKSYLDLVPQEAECAKEPWKGGLETRVLALDLHPLPALCADVRSLPSADLRPLLSLAPLSRS